MDIFVVIGIVVAALVLGFVVGANISGGTIKHIAEVGMAVGQQQQQDVLVRHFDKVCAHQGMDYRHMVEEYEKSLQPETKSCYGFDLKGKQNG